MGHVAYRKSNKDEDPISPCLRCRPLFVCCPGPNRNQRGVPNLFRPSAAHWRSPERAASSPNTFRGIQLIRSSALRTSFTVRNWPAPRSFHEPPMKTSTNHGTTGRPKRTTSRLHSAEFPYLNLNSQTFHLRVRPVHERRARKKRGESYHTVCRTVKRLCLTWPRNRGQFRRRFPAPGRIRCDG